jgi:hypothetical protein
MHTTAEFEEWGASFGKVYQTPKEAQIRYQIWRKNSVMVVEHNNNSNNINSYVLGLNRFSDYTEDELKSLLGYRIDENANAETGPIVRQTLPKTVTNIDWRGKGAVTKVKDQGACGGCWAFSAIAAVEGFQFLRSGKLIELSEQEVISCATDGNKGCMGGTMTNAFGWIAKNGGVDSEDDYPYASKFNEYFNCSSTKAGKHVASFESYIRVTSYSEDALLAAVAQQPVSVAIAVGGSFANYKSGVFDDPKCGTALAHGVAVVGFGTETGVAGKDYWLVKNSWSNTWGEEGYVRIARGGGNATRKGKTGICGILLDCSFPCGGPSCPSLPPLPAPVPAPSQSFCQKVVCRISGVKDKCAKNHTDCW